jgi:hypothetical protein
MKAMSNLFSWSLIIRFSETVLLQSKVCCTAPSHSGIIEAPLVDEQSFVRKALFVLGIGNIFMNKGHFHLAACESYSTHQTNE